MIPFLAGFGTACAIVVGLLGYTAYRFLQAWSRR